MLITVRGVFAAHRSRKEYLFLGAWVNEGPLRVSYSLLLAAFQKQILFCEWLKALGNRFEYNSASNCVPLMNPVFSTSKNAVERERRMWYPV